MTTHGQTGTADVNNTDDKEGNGSIIIGGSNTNTSTTKTTSTSTNNSSGGGFVALLDLPVHSVVGIDGKSILLQRDDFVGIQLTTTTTTTTTVKKKVSTPQGGGGGVFSLNSKSNSNCSSSSSSSFHFITAKAAVVEKKTSSSSSSSKPQDQQHQQQPQNPLTSSFSPGSLTVGFILIADSNAAAINHNNNNNNILIRKYNPLTEEVDSKPVDDTTSHNLLHQIENKQIDPSRILQDDQILTPVHVDEWKRQTSYIVNVVGSSSGRSSNILKLRNIRSGDKIVPGTYDDDHNHNGGDGSDGNYDGRRTTTTTTTTGSTTKAGHQQQPNATTNAVGVVDGRSIHYPPIPVIVDLSNPQLYTHKHSGTRRYLARLTPQERTSFFFRSDNKNDDDNNRRNHETTTTTTTSAATTPTVLDRLLEEYYDGSFESILGDVQLSFIVFINLQCLSSLEHWKDLIAMLSLSVNEFAVDFHNNNNSSSNNNVHDRSNDDKVSDDDNYIHTNPNTVDTIQSIVLNHRHSQLYLGLLVVLPDQLLRMGTGDTSSGDDALSYSFLEDVDEANDNFLLPSLQRIYSKLVKPILADGAVDEEEVDDDNDSNLEDNDANEKKKQNNELFQKWIDAAKNFDQVIRRKFPATFDEHIKIEEIQDDDVVKCDDDDNNNNNNKNDDKWNGRQDQNFGTSHKSYPSDDGMDLDHHPWMNDMDDEDEDGPVVVPSEDIEASLARSSAAAAASVGGTNQIMATVPNDIRVRYPILSAAIMPTEDIVMTCARALDEQNDVSLVREAATYLEEIEQYK